jgi:predicted transcriptional regulator
MNWLGSRAATAITVRPCDETTDRLDHLAARLDRSRSYVAARAIENFTARKAWQLAKIDAGVAKADRGEFAAPTDVKAMHGKYVRHK